MMLADVALRLAFGLLAGAAIGLEREWRQKMAGVRTNCLVALGAAGFATFAGLVADPNDTRIAAQVVTGVGFLGGGVILREGISVQGLNTAATLWCSAMVGTLAGGGAIFASVLATAAVVGANLVLRPLMHRLDARLARLGRAKARYSASITAAPEAEDRLRTALVAALDDAGVFVSGVASAPVGPDICLTVHAEGESRAAAVEVAMARLAREPGVRASSWSEQRQVPDI
jgi:putative Mg2+ transporter-C (MgtC) family protein